MDMLRYHICVFGEKNVSIVFCVFRELTQLLVQNILGNECNKKLASPNINLTLGVIGALLEGNLICLFVMMFSNTTIFKHYVRNVFCF
jgi:hypothetical protein